MAEVTAPQNKIEVVDAGPCRKTVRIEIPAETVTATLGSSLDSLSMQAELPGFRKGHAPKRLVEKKFGSMVKSQAKEQLIGQAFQQAVDTHKLKVLGNPSGEQLGKVEAEMGKPMKIEIDVEVLPEFALPALEGIAINKPLIEVSDEMVTKEVDRMCLIEGALEEREAPESGDYLTGHATMKGDDAEGKVHFDSAGIVVQIPAADANGKGMIVGLVVEDLTKQLGAVKPGATVTVKANGPENHENEALRNKALVVTYKPERCDRIIPASAAELAKKYGMEDDNALREAIKMRLAQRVQIEQQAAMRQQVVKHLLDSVPMELPQRITADQAARNLQRHRYELMYRGVDAMAIEEKLATLRTISSDEAVRELKTFFILERASDILTVKVTEGELNSRIAMMAYERQQRPEKLRSELIQSNGIGEVFRQIRDHKTLDAMIAKAKVTDLPVEDYNKLIAEQAPKA